jgi:tetratricopeptide (TPR) repeat protein
MIEFERGFTTALASSGAPSSSATSSPSRTAIINQDVIAGPIRTADQLQQAVAEFDGQDPAVKVLLRHTQVLMNAREHRLALNLLRNVLMRSPDQPQALLRMGVCFREQGRFEEALKCFRALSKSTRSQESQILVAETLYMSERDEMALGAYREVLKSVVSDQTQLFEIYKNVGNIHVRAGDFESAEEFYNKAYCLNPRSDVLMINYGTLEIQRENLGEAVERFRQAVAINPENDKAWVGLAIVHRQMGDAELARGNAERALDINSKNRTAIRLAVEWCVQDGVISASVEHLQNYLAVECEDAEMSFTLAKIFTQMGRLGEARVELERVLALDPSMEGADQLARVLDRELAAR